MGTGVLPTNSSFLLASLAARFARCPLVCCCRYVAALEKQYAELERTLVLRDEEIAAHKRDHQSLLEATTRERLRNETLTSKNALLSGEASRLLEAKARSNTKLIDKIRGIQDKQMLGDVFEALKGNRSEANRLGKFLKRWAQLGLYRIFSRWRGGMDEIKRERALLKRVASRFQNGVLHRVVDGWKAATEQGKAERMVLQRFKARMSNQVRLTASGTLRPISLSLSLCSLRLVPTRRGPSSRATGRTRGS
jgi:hypothetical protein